MRYKNEGVWKTTGRPKEDSPVAQAKLLRCLQIINFLKNGRYSIQQIADRFDISERTVYRYLHLFEEVGLLLDQDFNKKFFLSEANSEHTEWLATNKIAKTLTYSHNDNTHRPHRRSKTSL